MDIDATAADLLLTTTRSVRRRLDLDRPVPREVILDCLRVAVQAPTGSNAQGWRWVVVTDAGKRAELARLYKTGRPYLERGVAEAGDDQTRKVYQGALYLADNLARVPVHVIACVERRPEGLPNVMVSTIYGSIIQAAWSFMLALRARGLGAAWTTLHLTQEKEAAAVLGIPYESVTQVALLPVAYTVGTDFKPAARAPVEEITYWDAWGSTAGTG